ncbi:Ubiquinone biosynthesis protein COQ4, mitochondrial [Amphibalanus amphitrite]|uniref:Ubiquinone biosynthesis protein COQ4, mitochondrial n=1 Tax=Amphibalanus amphitrite TaxID=1232801 RepID=A0A6A4W8V0_AMPAM|nr:Ubiquinone biosynthesis protein COQ4, mitochondrial [Amphibalanus amphitrite]
MFRRYCPPDLFVFYAWCLFYRDRPVINSGTVDLAALSRLPDGTLGREYIRFLEQQILRLRAPGCVTIYGTGKMR